MIGKSRTRTRHGTLGRCAQWTWGLTAESAMAHVASAVKVDVADDTSAAHALVKSARLQRTEHDGYRV